MAKKDVLLLAPTGSGKSLIYEAAIEIERQQNPKAVLLLCIPVNSLAKEKTKSHRQPTAFITMGGNLEVDGEGSFDPGDGDADVSPELIQQILDGKFAILAGHAESWLSKLGRFLIKQLRAREMIAVVVFDELHKFLHWKMRPQMQAAPAALRSKAQGAWFLYMTATMSVEDVMVAKEKFCMSQSVVTISASPVLDSLYFLNVRRPSSSKGYDGPCDGLEPGLRHMIDRVMEPWKDDVKHLDSSPKVSMLFCKVINSSPLLDFKAFHFQDINDIGKINVHLYKELKDVVEDEEECPWMANYARIGKITSRDITLMDHVRGWITSCTMQMGLDMKDVVYIILIRPPTRLEDFLQSWGRGGRRQSNGMVKKVVCICLFNLEDISDNIRGMSQEVRDFCLEHGCLRAFLCRAFGVQEVEVDKMWCCGSCSGLNCLDPARSAGDQ